MPPISSTLERREVLYSGRVQDVGFRYTARHLAGNHQVAGFVKNLPDGRVQLVVEGAPTELDRYLASLTDELSDHIRNAATDVRPATSEFAGFEVRY